MNKAIKKCCICNNNETGEFIIIDDNKYHLSCIEKMQKEKQELIEYLKGEIQSCKDKIFENSLTEDNFTLELWKSRLITYEKILSKIEKR